MTLREYLANRVTVGWLADFVLIRSSRWVAWLVWASLWLNMLGAILRIVQWLT